MEAKPICVICLPENFELSMSPGYGGNAPAELMKILNNLDDKTIGGEYWKDYYWFCFTKYGQIDAPEFKVFHPKDFTEIQFNELKDLILADLESMKNGSAVK